MRAASCLEKKRQAWRAHFRRRLAQDPFRDLRAILPLNHGEWSAWAISSHRLLLTEKAICRRGSWPAPARGAKCRNRTTSHLEFA